MHAKRLIVAAIVLPLFYCYVMYLPRGFFLFLICLISFISQAEFLAMYKVRDHQRYLFALLGIIPICMTYKYNDIPTALITVMLAMVLFGRLFVRKYPENALMDIAPYIVSFLYIPVMLSYFIKLMSIGPEIVIFLCAVIWGADSFALYAGKTIGRRSLYKQMSPNKTIEGAIAAIIGAVICSALLKAYFALHLSFEKTFLVGIVLALVGIAGDLAESMFKRDANVKDSGSLLPGHGGILDKIDGMLFAAPALYHMLIVFSH
ncbi:MAG: phosphatidate cytidylyltransferase [Nitrospirae bacterium]|uniref:phosphatidate cytidylyltransferase n=1 Tax=Candidatus Magnetobacterium casense TaxID=1455061 RepID=UPI0006979B55|nr:phosphatidate cytidylyltransferase [Candidatus Magnetobacterium casensis]MBF0338870.1 phosphatidate cytidylyltransferase [Nitrospirota bacterium]